LVEVVGVNASQVLPRLPAIRRPADRRRAGRDTYVVGSAVADCVVRFHAPTAVLTVWLTPVRVAVNGVIAGATTGQTTGAQVPVALVVAACAAIGAAANADATNSRQ